MKKTGGFHHGTEISGCAVRNDPKAKELIKSMPVPKNDAENSKLVYTERESDVSEFDNDDDSRVCVAISDV